MLPPEKIFIQENMLIKATCVDGTTYTGKVYKIVIQLDDNNKPHALLFISQDEKYIKWVERLKSIEIL